MLNSHLLCSSRHKDKCEIPLYLLLDAGYQKKNPLKFLSYLWTMISIALGGITGGVLCRTRTKSPPKFQSSSPYKERGHEQAISRSRFRLFITKKKSHKRSECEQINFINEKMEAEKHEKFSYFSAGYFPAFGIYHSLIYFMFS